MRARKETQQDRGESPRLWKANIKLDMAFIPKVQMTRRLAGAPNRVEEESAEQQWLSQKRSA